MASIYFLFILSSLLSCSAEFTDYMQVYEKECLGENKIHCSDGTCIWQHQYCDGKVDCSDGSDEELCLDHTPEPHLCNITHHYMCQDMKKCIPIVWLCNNRTDCPDGSDEVNCTDLVIEDNAPCKGFKCGSDQKCISPLWICDGVFDCEDHSDEDPKECRSYKGRRLCNHGCDPRSGAYLVQQISLAIQRGNAAIVMGTFDPGHQDHAHSTHWLRCPTISLTALKQKMYPCLDGILCVDSQYMCNGMQDCKDGSDEGSFCKTWNVMCSTDICTANATCYADRNGPICLCTESYHAYNYTTKSCEPMNMCKQAKPYCSQICDDSGKGHFRCDCEEGYKKDRFNIAHLCVAPDPEALLFFTIRNEIKYFTLKSKKLITVATGAKQAHGVNYDGKYIYWVETAQGHQSIVRARLDDVTGTKQVVVGVGLEDPGDVVVDWLGGHIYFGDAERGIIAACNYDGTMCTKINTKSRVPKFLTLDVRRGKMYWADWHQKSVIMEANMDGSDDKVLVDKLDSFAVGLAVDSPSGRLYYVDQMLKGINLETGEGFVLFDNVMSEKIHQPYSLTVFENIIYWGDWASNTIQMTGKSTGDYYGVVTTLESSVYGLHLYHPILRKANFNPCAVHNCSHFCLIKTNETHTCACPDGMKVVPPLNNTCQYIRGYNPQYLVVGGGAMFTRVQYNLLGHPGTQLTYFDIGRVQAMAYDSLRDTLYMFDAQRKSINYIKMANFTYGVTRVLLYKGLDNVVDMDYDYITDSLYLIDAGHRCIEVVSLRTQKRAIIHHFENEIPISLCVLPEYGKMLIAVTESEQNTNIHLDSFNLDGNGQQHILVNNFKGPHIRLKYSQSMDNIYIADEGNSLIEHMHPEGTVREIYRELSTSVTNLAVTNMFVFWTDRRSSRLYWADIHDTSRTIRRIDLSIFPNKTHLHIQATNPPPQIIPEHSCQQHPCSDICVQTPLTDLTLTTVPPMDLYPSHSSGYKCLCPTGLVDVNGKCIEMMRCKENQAYCHISNKCIPKSSVCDGTLDCLHGEDEEGCEYHVTSNSTCAANEILCEGTCINKNKICTTSTTTPAPITCSEGEFSCVRDNLCLERAQMCDGISDCSDSSDEAPSLCKRLNCLHTEFMCSSGSCVLSTFRCDGDIDCPDGADELNCESKTCAAGLFPCGDGACVELRRRCDGRADCAGGGDERGCQQEDLFVNEEIENCAEWEHTCELNRSVCIPLTARCNGVIDCPGNTDEVNCDVNCFDIGFKCLQEGFCLPRRQICDGVKNCPDGVDETPDACKKVNRTSTIYAIPIYPADECHDGYHCANGQCIEWHNVCDNQPNCFDGSDENALCATACVNHTCGAWCRRSPRGPRCGCPPGRALAADRSTCQDADECREDVCSQHCHNTPGSFLCSCYRGYALRSDRRSCKATKGNMSVLYVTGNSVRSITADGYIAVEYNDSSAGRITDMDYDVRREMLYVTSVDARTLIQVNGSSSEVISNVGRPGRAALDWVTGNIYFIDSSRPASYVRVCNVFRKRCARLQKLPAGSEVTALVIDPAYRRLFYCVTRDLESVVWSSTLAGDDVTHIAVTHNCTGLAVDSYKKRLYVAETGPAHIVTMNYDGNMFKQLLTEDPHLESPHDLAIFEDHIYFLVANSFKLSRCVLFGQKRCEVFLQRVFNANTFLIKHENVQRDDIPDYCNGADCDNVCVPGDAAPICLCDGGVVSATGRCPLVDKKELPLFNGWTLQDYQHAHQVSVTLISCVSVLFVVYFSVFLYYHFVYRRRRAGAANYIPVHFQNTRGGEHSGSLSPITTSSARMQPRTSGFEFVNPMQMIRNMRTSLRKKTRPIGTAGLDINVPPLDVSDTESDLDDRENKPIVKKHEEKFYKNAF